MTLIEFPTAEASSARLSDRLGLYRFDPLAQLGCSTVRGIDFGSSADRTDGSEAATTGGSSTSSSA